MRSYTLISLALASVLGAGCNLKKPNPEDIYSGPAQPEADGALPDLGKTVLHPPVAGWRWMDLPGTECRDGSETGIAFEAPRDKDGSLLSDKLVIYLRGGNACMNTACVEQYNPGFFGKKRWDAMLCRYLDKDDCRIDAHEDDGRGKWKADKRAKWFGILDGDPANPFATWNKVFIPYCSGDWHAGLNDEDIEIGKGESRFMGSKNTRHALAAIVQELGTDFDKVLVTGASAGGVGAMLNFHRFAEVFGPERTYLISDGGPQYPDAHVASCLQARAKNLWRMDRSFPVLDGCPGDDCVWNQDAWMSTRMRALFDGYGRGRRGTDRAGSRMALLVSDKDSVTLTVLWFMRDDCARLDDLVLAPASERARIEAAAEAATDALVHEIFDDYNDVKIFQVDDTQHMWMSDRKWWDMRFVADEDGQQVRLTDWVAAMLDEDPSWDHARVTYLRPASEPVETDILEVLAEAAK
jgi:hypothetical protein